MSSSSRHRHNCELVKKGGPFFFVLLLLLLWVGGGGVSAQRVGTPVQCVTLPLSNSTGDLSFHPLAPSSSHPRDCIAACRQQYYRYAGVGGGVAGNDCVCGNAYGLSGTSSNCVPCAEDGGFKCGTQSGLAVYETMVTTSAPPTNLRGGRRTENAIEILWNLPSVPTNHLKGYTVTATPLFTYSRDGTQGRTWEFMEPELRSTYLVGLVPATRYEIALTAIGTGGSSEAVKQELWTKIGTPDMPTAPKVSWQQGQTLGIEMSPLPEGGNSKGPVSAYRLAVIDEKQLGFFNKETKMGWKDGEELGYYIAAEWTPDSLPSSFTVGTGNSVGGFYNGPLPRNRHWHPSLGVVSTLENTTKYQFSSTGHFQHSHFQYAVDDAEIHAGGGGKKIVVREENPGIVATLWVAIGLATFILLLVLVVFILLKLNLLHGKSSRRSRPARGGESHPLSHSGSASANPSSVSVINVPYNDFLDCGGYTHLAFMPEEEDWGRRFSAALTSVPCIPRAEILIPEDDPEVVTSNVPDIAMGRFGMVYQSKQSGTHSVQLYQLPTPSSFSNSMPKAWNEEMYRSADLLLRPSAHVNIVSMAGFVQTEENLYLVIRAGEEGQLSLKDRLIQSRQDIPKSSQPLILCAMGISEGLFHLHSYKFNHGELCGWNVLLPASGEWSNPKLTGFGILSSNPQRKERDKSRWMSVEQIHNRCVPPSDSWAFGVVLWEIATLGATPYGDIRTEDIKKRIERGARPPQLDNIGDALYQLMLTCWQLDRDERPDAGTLACQLHQLLPSANEELGLWESCKWPPYIESLEYLPSTK